MSPSGAFRSLHCLIYKVLARPPQRRSMFYLTTSSGFCQALFSTFSKFFRRLSQLFAALSDSSFILPELPEFVKHFFRFARSFFALDAGTTAAFQTACLLYQTFPPLSTFSSKIFHFFCFLFPLSFYPVSSSRLYRHSLPYRTQIAWFFALFSVHIGHLSYILLL